MNSQSKPSGKKSSMEVSDEQFLATYKIPGAFPTFLDDSPARRLKFGLSATSPPKNSLENSSIFTSPLQSELDIDTSMTLSSPPTSPIKSPIRAGSDLVETSDWYCPELWSRNKVVEQENRASKLIGDYNRIKATLEYYCANDLQYHSKWVRILADHILLLAESRGQELNIAVAYHVSQQKASKYRQQLEASILESEAKRVYEEEMEIIGKGSLRGKSKIARTDEASISKGTHPLSKKASARRSLPKEMMPDAVGSQDVNFKLVGPDDFLKTLKMSKKTEKEYFESFRQLRDDIFQSIRSPGIPYEPLFFVHGFDEEVDTNSSEVAPFDGQRTPSSVQRPQMEVGKTSNAEKTTEDPDPMDIDIPKLPGHLDSNEECAVQ
ncbi:hypothetical protein TWF281_008712 [Arthrobotrys megalospora]